MFVRRFLGIDISVLSTEEAREKVKEAEFVRELDVGVMAQAINLAFFGK